MILNKQQKSLDIMENGLRYNLSRENFKSTEKDMTQMRFKPVGPIKYLLVPRTKNSLKKSKPIEKDQNM